MRSLGYDLPSALADLIDNSITAKANQIKITYSWMNGDPYILISDNGLGMSYDKLKEAMTPGSSSPLEERDLDDLGRFGLGLKTASWSQCKRMTVLTKNAGNCSHYTWDLEHVNDVDKWELLEELNELESEIISEKIDAFDSGTAVMWTNLDRVMTDKTYKKNEEHFHRIMQDEIKPHLEMVFHRFLESGSLRIFVGRAECEAWDPFMSKHAQTVKLIGEKYSDNKISITPYILPHSSKLTQRELEIAEGAKGWIANQGFFVYRRDRIIIAGGYFNLKKLKREYSYRLCRIKVDLTNEFDLEWKVDVKKNNVVPPAKYHDDFVRIATAARNRSANVYKARTVSRTRNRKGLTSTSVWQRKKIGNKVQYKINPKSPGIDHIIKSANIDKKFLRQIFHLVERTLPYMNITIDNNELNDATIDLPHENIQPPEGLVELAKGFLKDRLAKGQNFHEALDFITYDLFPNMGAEFRAELEDMEG